MSLPSLSQLLTFVGVHSNRDSQALTPAKISKRAERWINRSTSVSVISIELDGAAHHLAVLSSEHGVCLQTLGSAVTTGEGEVVSR